MISMRKYIGVLGKNMFPVSLFILQIKESGETGAKRCSKVASSNLFFPSSSNLFLFPSESGIKSHKL